MKFFISIRLQTYLQDDFIINTPGPIGNKEYALNIYRPTDRKFVNILEHFFYHSLKYSVFYFCLQEEKMIDI